MKCLKLQPLIWTKKNLGALWVQNYIFDCYLTTNKIAKETKSVVKAFHFLVIVTLFITFYEVTRPKFGQIYNLQYLLFDTHFAYLYENWHNIQKWNVEAKKHNCTLPFPTALQNITRDVFLQWKLFCLILNALHICQSWSRLLESLICSKTELGWHLKGLPASQYKY